MPADAPLTHAFYERPVLEVATDLLGAVVTHCSDRGPVAVRLTEVEAYDGETDPGSHAFRGRTPRNAVMFGRAGHVYVYFTYGMHWCMNLVCGPVGEASAVLLRAGEVLEGADLAAVRRPTAKAPRELARGPARLTSALGVDGGCNGADATDPGSPLTVTRPAGRRRDAGEVLHGPRVGVAGDGALHPWRFWLAGEPSVSAYRPAVSRRRPPRG
ncbi:MAG TPA: DNA-3-methyladenine glycosylase [Actinomycetes bacterium]|nr:DNA-3-methyladenine glycosylase [Actinomycetes bacterium]